MVFSEYILDELTKLDYNVHAEIINFADFGIPQRRKRFILVGFQNGDAKYFFSKLINNKTRFLKKEGIKHNITVKEAISDLERKHGEVNSKEFKNFKEGLYGDVNSNYQKLMRGNYLKRRPDSHRFANHSQMINEKFNYILKNCPRDKKVDVKTRKDFNLRKYCTTPLDYNKPSPTLTTLPDDLIHYSEPRILTVREYARIQSFDDWYEFKGSYTTGGKRRREEVPRYTQIGNAIPPLFMNQVGEALKEVIW